MPIGMSDEPGHMDRQRLRIARSQAKARLTAINQIYSAQLLASMRIELGMVVRSASPLLPTLVESEGLTLDDAVKLLGTGVALPPGGGWLDLHAAHRSDCHMLRYYVAGLSRGKRSTPSRYEHRIDLASGGYLLLQVEQHSLELMAYIGCVRLCTRFGRLRIRLPERLTETLLSACVGRLVEEVVDHVSLRGRGWRIEAVEDYGTPLSRQTLVVATGSLPYVMPWAR